MENTCIMAASPLLPFKTHSLQVAELQLLLSGDMEAAKVKELITTAKRNYVISRHKRSITKLKPSKNRKNGCYKTRIYIDGIRRDVSAATEEKLIEKLYEYYYNKENAIQTLQQAFEAYIDYKKKLLEQK